MSTDVLNDFTTPDRKTPRSLEKEKKNMSSRRETKMRTRSNDAATVTPPESASSKLEGSVVLQQPAETPDDKHVRFDKDGSPTDSPGSQNSSQRGLVSRRGGRYPSPGRGSKPASPKETVLEFKTYRSPPRVKKEDDNVPSLCSAKSFEKTKKEDGEASTSVDDKKPASISCDASIPQTSPLATDQDPSSAKIKKEDTAALSKKSNVSFSPVPKSDPEKSKILSKSPPGDSFQNLPGLHDDSRSPGGIFLSPKRDRSESIERADKKDKATENQRKGESRPPPRSPKTPTPRTPRRDDRLFATPTTDFAMDYGKPPGSNSGFESSQVLAWLQSPNENGLFSPGFGSLMNTPKGGMDPRTPRTPTVSTSFFFSDVAELPRSGQYSPKPPTDGNKRPGSRGYSNIICISPLASTKSKNGAGGYGTTPTMDYNEMFASPEKSRGLSMLSDSPLKGARSRAGTRSASKNPSLDAVHMAEQEVMEDEDLNILMQLASNTPKKPSARSVTVTSSDGAHVFRSPNGRRQRDGDKYLPSLQVPIIGGRDGDSNGARLARKTHSRDHGEPTEDYSRFGLRTSVGDRKGAKTKDGKPEASKKGTASTAHHPPPPYPMHPHPYAHPDAAYYPPPPPGIPPHAGTMRVAVGVPPPVRTKSGSPGRPGHPSRPYMGPGDPNYPHPPYAPPGHYHPGVPPPHMHPHYGAYPPPHHAPPRHMGMYPTPHGGSAKSSKKPIKGPKPGMKRPLALQTTKTVKKSKKSSPGSGKKKNRSPQITDKVERQKAAQRIQEVNAASGGKNDKAAALAAAILRGVTMRPSGKWQAQLYFAGKSRYIGVFDTREKAALAYEIAREKLKSVKASAEGGSLTTKETEAAVNAARKAAFEGVNEKDPRLAAK